MLRRDFLRKTSLALAAGLIVGDEALEAFARLTHQRKSFPSADVTTNVLHNPAMCQWRITGISGNDSTVTIEPELPTLTDGRSTLHFVGNDGPRALADLYMNTSAFRVGDILSVQFS